MAASAHLSAPAEGARSAALTRAAPQAAAWTLGFALVAYLALSGGGFDVIVSSHVGIALWWTLLVGVLAGILPVLGWGRPALAVAALLLGLAVWTGLSIAWSDSAERSFAETSQVVVYAGALLLAFATQRAVGGRSLLHGVACAIGVISGLAVVSWLQPTWFPEDDVALFLGDNGRRLNYPLNYWNGLACFAALGMPLMAVLAAEARTRIARSAAAAALPLLVLAVYLAVSRGGVLAGAAGVVVLMAMVRGRLPQLTALAPAALGSVILVAAVAQRDELRLGTGSEQALQQGDEILAMCLVVLGGVALLHVTAWELASRVVRPWVERNAPRLRLAGLAAAALALLAAVAVGAPSRVADDWRAFKSPDTPETIREGEDVLARLGNPAGNGRYQYWMAAKDAGAEQPLTGIGAGTFEFRWTENPTFDGPYIRHAHSLWFESFGELGLPGLLLVVGLFGTLLVAGTVRTLRAPPDDRPWRAAALATVAVFCVFATYDWVWDIPVLPVIALLVGAVLLLGTGAPAAPVRAGRARWAVAALAAAALAVLAVQSAGATEVRSSQGAAADGDLAVALQHARTAANTQPYSASAHLQEALVLEELGAFDAALAEAREATRLERGNWRLWLVRSRLEARAGDAAAAVASYRRARDLNPASPIFKR